VKIKDILHFEWHRKKALELIDCNLDELPTDIPEVVYEGFNCSRNKLKSLKGCPRTIKNGVFACSYNQLESLEGCPESIIAGPGMKTGAFILSNNFASLHNIHKHLKRIDGYISLNNNPITSCILGLMLIENLEGIGFTKDIPDPEPFNIVGNGLRLGKDILDVQEELIFKGYKEYARL
jgi:hypothetical protein